MGLSFCISNKLPDGADAAGLRTTLGIAKSWRVGLVSDKAISLLPNGGVALFS